MDDSSNEEALRREIREELNGRIEILKLIYILERETGDGPEQELFYLCTISTWSEEHRTGPEFSERGRYDLAEVRMHKATLQKMAIKPAAVRDFIVENMDHLESLPDLRRQPGPGMGAGMS